ncbi:protein unc-93 homolog A isoform X2 [Chelonus insularis]|uniref:protein unc-93 homolog A isoform X2 n=1 Tax=Chelonus insularis TaxID=460826 RepID=UPI00158C3753|nr:protein unc-93 homolog A isoform X2 [Chelonus insularis]
MGSLPNLHELSKGRLDSSLYRPTPTSNITQTKLPPHPTPLAQTNRRVRSTTHHHALWDDTMLEHMMTYSPISCQSARASTLSCRRRESMTSSAGTSSVRKLIAAVRATPSGPRLPKKVIAKHCAVLFFGHMIISAVILPIMPLQAGFGAFNPSLGPLLLTLLYAVATLTSCFSPMIIQKFGINLVISLSHLITTIFISTHLFPKWYILLPSYALLGITISPSFVARILHIDICAANLSIISPDSEDSDESRRECLLRRLNRAMKLAEDLGLAIGCLIATLIITIINPVPLSPIESDVQYTCGAKYCPQETFLYNETLFMPSITSETTKLLLSVLLGLCLLAFGISCTFLDSRIKKSQTLGDGSRKIAHLKSIKASFQDPKLQLAAPLTLFIGLEQGFIFCDFTEAFVGCALGNAGTITTCFLSFALLQALAGVTLSMLIRHIRRYLVVALLLGLYPCTWQGPLSTSIFWKCLGIFLALGLHGLVCTRFRVFGLAGMLVLSAIPYAWLEIRLSKRVKCLAPL